MPKVSEAHSAARRRQIIDAAYRCFARKGFHQTTMREIYEEADLSPGAVYHYFDGKDAIIRSSFEFDRERGQVEFARALEGADPLQALHAIVSHFFRGLDSAAELGAGRVNIQGWAEAMVNPRLLEPLKAGMESYLDSLSQVVQKAQRSKQIDPELDPQAVGSVLLSLYYGLELQKALFPNLPIASYQAVVEHLVLSRNQSDFLADPTNAPDQRDQRGDP